MLNEYWESAYPAIGGSGTDSVKLLCGHNAGTQRWRRLTLFPRQSLFAELVMQSLVRSVLIIAILVGIGVFVGNWLPRSPSSPVAAVDLTREAAAEQIRTRLDKAVAVINMKINDVSTLVGQERSVFSRFESMGMLEKKGDCRSVQVMGHRGFEQDTLCNFTVTASGRQHVADDKFEKVTTPSGLPYCLSDRNCIEVTWVIARFKLGVVTGITALEPSLKRVDYTAEAEPTPIAVAFRSDVQGSSLPQSAIFRKFDDGWRLEGDVITKPKR